MNTRRSTLSLLTLGVVTIASVATSSLVAGKGKPGGGEVPQPPVTYIIQQLEPGTGILDMNNQADAVGRYTDENGDLQPALFVGGVTYDLNELLNDPDWLLSSFQINGISDRDEFGAFYVVGGAFYLVNDDEYGAYRMRIIPGKNGDPPTLIEFRDLGNLDGKSRSRGKSVNANGEVVGTAYNKTAAGFVDWETFYYSDSTGMVATGIQSLSGSYGVHIVDSGLILGTFVNSDGSTVAFRISPDGQTETWQDTEVYGVNTWGDFVGTTKHSWKVKRRKYNNAAVIEDEGGFRLLAPLRERAYDLNDSGDVLNSVSIQFNSSNTTFDLNDMLDSSNSATDLGAWFSHDNQYGLHLSNSGVIAVRGVTGNSATGSMVEQGFLLIPMQ